MYLLSNLLYRLTAPLRWLTAPFRIVLGWPIRLVVNPGRLLGLSLPTRVALFLALFLVLLVATAVGAVILFPEAAEWQQFARPSLIALVAVLLISIPLIARQTVRLFIEGNVASHPRIDEAWREGIAALKTNNLDLNRLPLFLVLGASDRAQMDAIMDHAGMKLLVRGVPEGRQPLRWYAGERGIVLACTEVGCLTLVSAPQPSSQPAQHTLRPQGVGETLVTGTMPVSGAGDAAAEGSPYASTPEFSPSVWGTLVAGEKNARARLRPRPTVALVRGRTHAGPGGRTDPAFAARLSTAAPGSPAVLPDQRSADADFLAVRPERAACQPRHSRGGAARLVDDRNRHRTVRPHHGARDRDGVGERVPGTGATRGPREVPRTVRQRF